MNDRAAGLLEQYEIEVLRTRKGRGAIVCDTNQGCLIFKEYSGNVERIRLQDRLLKQIAQMGSVCVESILPARDGELLVKDNDGNSYVLKTYFEGRECNIYDKSECTDAVRTLAKLHSNMILPIEDSTNLLPYSQELEYEKHNRELKRVRRFLRQKSQKTWFEIGLLNTFDYFLEQALEVTEQWHKYAMLEQSNNEKQNNCFCHGDYQYHNIVKTGKEWCIINFEKCIQDNQIRDLYLLLRKLLEKSNWSVNLGTDLLAAYESISPICAYSKIDLYYRMAYPEKFWKIVNFYYNSGKSWIPERNQDKLVKLLGQEEQKQYFLDVVFRSV